VTGFAFEPVPEHHEFPKGNTVKTTRFGAIAAIALTGAFALASCAANEGGGGDTPARCRAPSTAPDRRSGFGAGGLDRGLPDGQPRRDHQLRPEWFWRRSRDLHRRRLGLGRFGLGLNDDELAGAFGSCAAGTKAIDLRPTSPRSRSSSNVEGVTDLNLDAETIAHIFKGDITTWNDPAIAALNEGVTLPDTAITAVHRSDDSGTDRRTSPDYLNKVAPEVWDAPAADPFPYQTGEGAQGTSGVVGRRDQRHRHHRLRRRVEGR
jgi:phosphate transport system substrate-binding protein